MVLLAGVDPLHYMQEILVVSVAVIALSLIYVYWNRFIFLLTGDDRLHCSSLDCIWWGCCRCGGACNGEWTRLLTRCPCCPNRLRGRNLIRSFGQMIGWATHSIEIKNIIVGDLPFDGGRGDFYLSVEASTNPPMVTALQEEKLPKVVHFPEIIGLKIRDSILERRVRLVVKELNVVGSNDLCDCHLSSSALIDWASNPNPEARVKRFIMRACDNSIERETPAWCLLELAEADDVRGVDTLPNTTEGGLYIRTWVPTDHETVRQSGAQPVAYSQDTGGGRALGQNMWLGAARQNVDLKVAPFKHNYTLLDDAGNPVAEPSEESLAGLRIMRKAAACAFCLFHGAVWLSIFAWLIFRFYVWSCFRHFRWLTEAKLRNAKFPISHANLLEYVKDCHDKFDGTGLGRGTNPTTNLAEACRPSDATIVQTCEALPYGQPRPEAFTLLIYNWFGIQMKHGIHCFNGICAFRNKIHQYDWIIAGSALVLILMTLCCKYCMNQCIKAQRRNNQDSAAAKQKDRVRNPTLGAGSGYGY